MGRRRWRKRRKVEEEDDVPKSSTPVDNGVQNHPQQFGNEITT